MQWLESLPGFFVRNSTGPDCGLPIGTGRHSLIVRYVRTNTFDPNSDKHLHLFSHTQWLPHTVAVQWIYLVYRAVVFFYFLVWLVAININESSPNILIYLTQWSFITFNAYLLLSLLTTIINFILVYVSPKKKRVTSSLDIDDDDDDDDVRRCGCSSTEDQTTVCDKLTWFMFLIGTESTFLTVLLFWILIGDNTEIGISVTVNIHLHVLNGAVALLEVWITGLPIHLLHFIYILLFGSTYAVFTGVHYSVNGTGYDDERYIYPVLDYGSNLGSAIGTILICVLVVCPLVHLFFYLQYLLRHWLTTHLQRHVNLYHRYFDHVDLSAPIPVLYLPAGANSPMYT